MSFIVAGFVRRLMLNGSRLGQALFCPIWQWTLRTGSEDLLWKENDVGAEPLPTLTDNDLKEIGLPQASRPHPGIAQVYVSAS